MLTISQQAGDDGRLFGSVTTQDIADAIQEARGIAVDRRKIHLDEPIKHAGTVHGRRGDGRRRHRQRQDDGQRAVARAHRPVMPKASPGRPSVACRRGGRAGRAPGLPTCDDFAQACEESRRVCGEARAADLRRCYVRTPLDEHSPRPPMGRGSDGAQGPPAGVAPPHSLEAEQSVLGAMLLSDRTHYALVIEEGLKAEDFYRERHREVYESMLELFTAGEPIDVLTVTEHLRSRGRLDAAGGAGGDRHPHRGSARSRQPAPIRADRPRPRAVSAARNSSRRPCAGRGPARFSQRYFDAGRIGPAFAYFSIHAKNSRYQSREFCGFRIQWFSSGK